MTQNQRDLLAFLRTKRAGEIVSEGQLLSETQWARTTLKTYRSKHYTDPFLAYQKGSNYRILRNGSEITEQEILSAFTQVRPGIFVLTQGMRLTGTHGAYELKSALGNGAVGHVWKSTKVGTEVQMAAKVMIPRTDLLNPSVIGNVRQRFLREARNGQRLSHPNLIGYRDYGEVDGTPFLIMDLAERSVADILKTRALSVEESLSVVSASLAALAYLHTEQCEHRDVKPANMLQIGPEFLLADLGIVSWGDMNPAFTSAATITRDSLQLGSWHYMAPEQRRSPHGATPLSDVYALGVSWYEMLTRTTLDPSEVGARAFASATTEDPLDRLIREMLSFNAKDRPSVARVVEKIRDYRSEIGRPCFLQQDMLLG